ncbi:MAG TPA: hypothetical protein VFR78_01950 [Pyrinomonadaceae bacterium]|nr:hypothetical protein [Pyrinomonadaceae bacterium]
MTWTTAETNTHQDHVIAHVIGATPLGHFIWDETAYLLLDIGFIWNIYLNMEMGLVPHPMAITELEADDSFKSELRSDIDQLMRGESPVRMTAVENFSPIESVELLESGDSRRLVLNCEQGQVVVETQMNAEDPRSSVTIS